MPNTRYMKARVSVGPLALEQFDPTKYQVRTQAIQESSTNALLDAQARAAARKVAEKQAADDARKAALEKAQANLDARVKASQAKTTEYQNQVTNRLGVLANQTRIQPNQAPVGQSGYRNPNFPGGTGGQLVAVGGNASKKAAGIINEALKYRGMMYQWGGSTPKTSFDCSGLVQWAYRSMGVTLPRISAAQASSGRKVPLSNLRPGDLVAWDNSSRNNGADHIAIFIGNGQIIEAPRTGQQIRVRALGNEQNAWGVQILK